METLPPRKVFCGKQLFKQNPCSGMRAERVGTPGTGIQDAGNGDSGVLESEIYESRIQGAGTRDSVGTMVSWPHGTREVLVRQLGGLVVTRASRLRGTRIQGCRNQKLRATWDQDSRMPKTGTLKARDSGALGARIQGCWNHASRATCRTLGSQGYRESVTLAGRNTVRRDATLSGRA